MNLNIVFLCRIWRAEIILFNDEEVTVPKNCPNLFKTLKDVQKRRKHAKKERMDPRTWVEVIEIVSYSA